MITVHISVHFPTRTYIRRITDLGAKGQTLKSTMRNASRPKTRKSESTNANAISVPMRAVHDIYQELKVL
jgi:hypothetical protein